MSGHDSGAPARTRRPPVRIAHLGLGAFHRAHQAWYTAAAEDPGWGIAAFTGRSPQAAQELAAQDGLYSLVVRSAERDDVVVVDSIVRAEEGSRVDRLAGILSSPDTALVTLTVTEAGYALDAQGRPDESVDAMREDIARLPDALRAGGTDAGRTPLGRLLLGIEARRRADAGPLAVVPCDNLPDNGPFVRTGLRALAERVSPRTLAYLDESVSFVSTSVDRITPRTTSEDAATVARLAGWHDRAPVVTEPFHDWVLSGAFPAGRPAWERVGARFVDDIEPFERRKLWLLNGAHSLLAYVGSLRGHSTVAEAVGDPVTRDLVEQLWDEASRHLPTRGLDLPAYRAALLDRFDNGRIRHSLDQIGQDAVAKLRVRIAPVLLAERDAGRDAPSAVAVLGAWVAAARSGSLPADRAGASISRAAAETGDRAVRALLLLIDPALAEDSSIVAAVSAASYRLGRR
ncbi:mannitol dehydrogenase family protein [Rathayibacter sp. VKM Ac-2803]|uniref:mannitol dehydrogenase family protein n=1 Tax=Rathayibacter sp. VKM Ac-2803 TaxID=2609256 RepID=UPI001358FED1|nr:mannitol dehydrogenase family protein [Rathayibacter sp. VKM Ac-2803]MWV47773.1 mannitol dehydrogenase family protein [Rathayibacter sp. VKM Ac-2803]